jgi:hypothetical protein
VTLVNPSEMRTQAGTEYGPPLKERLDPGEASEPEDVAEAIVFSTQTESPNTVSELDFFVRDKYNTIGGI